MNRIFKVVWSKSRQAYIVVSEYAKSRGGKTKLIAAVLAFVMGICDGHVCRYECCFCIDL